MTTVMKPMIKHKTFSYSNQLKWVWKRSGMLNAAEKPEIRVSSPPEFRGESGVWTPEDLFVASVNICQMTTFLAFAEKKKLPVLAYSCEAEGTLEFVNGNFRFTRITLRPTVHFTDEATSEEVQTVMEDAHRRCLISNSILAEVVLEPVFQIDAESQREWVDVESVTST